MEHGMAPDYDYDELDRRRVLSRMAECRHGVFAERAALSVHLPGLIGVTSESAEVSVQRPVIGRLSATAGVGLCYFEGAGAGRIWLLERGAAYDLAP